jgi:hypothetical protein
MTRMRRGWRTMMNQIIDHDDDDDKCNYDHDIDLDIDIENDIEDDINIDKGQNGDDWMKKRSTLSER